MSDYAAEVISYQSLVITNLSCGNGDWSCGDRLSLGEIVADVLCAIDEPADVY
jgi:hypothetical protein